LFRVPFIPARQKALSLRLHWLVCLSKISVTIFLAALATPAARADIGVVLNESLDEDMDRISSTGHSAVYFSRICPESPVKLRLCGSGEMGTIVSNYINIGEDQPYEWNAVPLSVYLFGVEDPRNRPLFGSYKIKHLLEDRYREKYLAGFCTAPSCSNSQKSEWREMVAATLVRGVYIFSISTTVEQDRQFIAEFNAAANKNHFNGVTRNCADFTRRIINTYFPHATRPDYLNDFGMTSPKAVARTFTRYAERHPESQLRIMHFAQVPGTIKRSRTVRSGTEQLFHSGKLAVPMTLALHFAVPVVTTSYFVTARFNADKEFAQHPASLLPLPPSVDDETAEEQIVGTPEQWKELRKSLYFSVAENSASGGHMNISRFFKQLDETGTPYLQPNGSVWMDVSKDGQPAKLGLSASNIVAPGSDLTLSYDLLLTRASHILKSKPHARETMLEFNQDWINLQRTSALNATKKQPTTLARAQITLAPAVSAITASGDSHVAFSARSTH
jgi:hypothetical protein